MSVKDRVLAALRARFFLHIWRAHIITLERRYPDLYSAARSFISPASFKIFNRLCDTLVLLALAYARHYPDQPFCPWLLGTDFLEHFFGLARCMLPNFTYAELLKLVKHVMLRQKILLSRKPGTIPKSEREARSGYLFDFDNTPLTPNELRESHVKLTITDLNGLVELAANEASKIARQLLHMKVAKPGSKHPWVLAGLDSKYRSQAHRKRTMADIVDDDDDSAWESDLEEDLHDDSEPDDAILDEPLAATAGLDPSATSMALRLQDSTQHCARYAALCEDYETSRTELEGLSLDTLAVTASLIPDATRAHAPTASQSANGDALPEDAMMSAILDKDRKVSVAAMLRARQKHQSGTAVKSERVIALDPKFALSKLDGVMTGKDAERQPRAKGKMSVKEAAHRVRITQVLHSELQREKTTREHRYETQSKKIQKIAEQKQSSMLLLFIYS